MTDEKLIESSGLCCGQGLDARGMKPSKHSVQLNAPHFASRETSEVRCAACSLLVDPRVIENVEGLPALPEELCTPIELPVIALDEDSRLHFDHYLTPVVECDSEVRCVLSIDPIDIKHNGEGLVLDQPNSW